jgi:hypothetical protein
MSTAPHVALTFNPTDLRPRDLPKAGEFLGTPADAIEAALMAARIRMIEEMKTEVRGLAEPTHAQMLRAADLAWQAMFWRYRKISAPIMADAYIRAYRAAGAGDVPMSVIYDLADKHAEKIGDYFHGTSRDALAEGFNILVNRRVPAKAAADRVLDAYGLTPRQMRGFTSNKQFAVAIESPAWFDVKARARLYIDRSLTQRVKKLAKQEEHNIDEQAKQFAWMWMQDKGQLTEKAQKMWITAKDERVCPVCGPLHGKKVGINDQFKTAEGVFWTPGLHPNCRCVVRLIENRFSKNLQGGQLVAFNELHPRAEHGRFGTKTKPARTTTIDVDTEFDRIISAPVLKPTGHLTYYAPPQAEAEPDHALDQQFASLVEAQPKTQGFTSVWGSPLEKREFQALATEQIQDPEPRIDFTVDLAVELRRQLATDPKLKQFKTATIPLGQPAYAVITPDQLDNGDIKRIRLNHGIEFKTDEIAAAQEAGEYIQRTVERRIDEMVDHGARVEMQDERSGLWYHANLSPNDVHRVAEWYANSATSHWHEDYDSNFIGDDSIAMDWELDDDVDLRYDKGTTLPPKLRYSAIGEQFELRETDFEVYVVRADQVPDDEGSVEDISGSANSKHRSFSIDGDYTLVPGSIGKVVHDNSYAVTTFRIEPEDSVTLEDQDLNYPDKSE